MARTKSKSNTATPTYNPIEAAFDSAVTKGVLINPKPGLVGATVGAMLAIPIDADVVTFWCIAAIVVCLTGFLVVVVVVVFASIAVVAVVVRRGGFVVVVGGCGGLGPRHAHFIMHVSPLCRFV